MKLTILFLFVTCASLIFLISCKTNSDFITAVDGVNINVTNEPTVASTTNSFAITVKADAYNVALEYPLTVTKNDFDMALSITNLTAGDATIQIYNDSKQMLYKGDYSQKISLAQIISLDDRPTKIRFIFNTLSATFSCTLTAK
jgi:hypothetical protein